MRQPKGGMSDEFQQGGGCASKVAIGLGLGLVMLSSAPAVDAASGPFPDVPATYWAASAISALKAQGIITGEADGKFHPAQPVTREQFAALIVRVEHLPAVTKGPAFTDLGASALSPAVETAAANGLMLGTTLTTFAPLEPITRAMAATIAVRALGLSQVALDLAPLTSGFSDASQIPSYATGSVVSAKRLGILQGYPSGDFKPNVTIDRAQAAVLIYRLETVPQTAIQHLAAVVATGVNAGSYTQQIAVGGSVGLWASVYDQSSVPVPAPVSWSASGGSAGHRRQLHRERARSVHGVRQRARHLIRTIVPYHRGRSCEARPLTDFRRLRLPPEAAYRAH